MNPGAGDLGNAAAQSDPVSWLVQLLQTYVNLYQEGFNQFSALLQNPVGMLQQIISAFATNPVAALVAYSPLLFFGAYEVISPIATYGPMLMALSLGVSLSLGQITLPLGEVAPIAAPIAAGAAGIPALASTASTVWPVASLAPTVATPAGAPASVGAAGAGTAAAPAPAATTGTFAYMVGFGGGPGTESGPTVGPRGRVKAPAATIPAAGAVAPSRAEARARRRRRAAMREYGDEFLDMDSDIGVAPDYGSRRSGRVRLSGGFRERGRAAGIRGDRTQRRRRGRGRVDQTGRRRVRWRPAGADGAGHLGPGSRQPGRPG